MESALGPDHAVDEIWIQLVPFPGPGHRFVQLFAANCRLRGQSRPPGRDPRCQLAGQRGRRRGIDLEALDLIGGNLDIAAGGIAQIKPGDRPQGLPVLVTDGVAVAKDSQLRPPGEYGFSKQAQHNSDLISSFQTTSFKTHVPGPARPVPTARCPNTWA